MEPRPHPPLKIADEFRRARLAQYALLVCVSAMDQKRMMHSIEASAATSCRW